MENRSVDPIATMAETLAAIQTQLQALAPMQTQIQAFGDKLTQLEQRRATVKNIPASQDAMEQYNFGEAQYSYDIAPKPPDPQWSPPLKKAETWVPFDFDNETFDYQRFEFSGSRNPRDYLHWEKDMDDYFWYYSIPKEEKLSDCLRQLTGKAYKWWIQEEDDRWWNKEPTINTWGQLKRVMRKRYVPSSFQRDFPDCFDRPPSIKTIRQKGPEQEAIPHQKAINQQTKEDKSITIQYNWDETQPKPSREDDQVSNIKVTSYIDDNSIIPPMASIIHLSLSKGFETDLKTKEKSIDETMNGKEDLTTQVEVTVQKPSLDTPELLSLDKGPTLTPHLQYYMTPTAHQGKCFTSSSPLGVECLRSEANMKPTPNGDKEHAKERDSFVKEGQLVIQANQMGNGEVDPNLSVKSSHHQSTTYSIPNFKSLKHKISGGDQNVDEEPQHTFKLTFQPNQNQGILYSLLIKEAAMGSFNIKQACTSHYGHKDYKETLWTSQDYFHTHQTCAINHESEIIPELMKSQGKLLNSHFYNETNLFSCYVGETVLRTKLCQGGGYDEDIQPSLRLGAAPKRIKQAELTRMDQMDVMHGYKAWDPGDGLLIYKAEDSRFEDMKTHAGIIPKHPMARTPDLKLQGVSNAFRAPNHLEMPPNSYIHPKESLHMPNTSLDSLHSSQSTIHQAKAENTQRLHSFSLIYGFIPQGFTGEVFNEANASHGVVLDGLEGPNTSHDQCQGVNTNQISEVLHFGDNKELSLFISKSRPWRHHEDTLARVEGLKTCFEDLWKTLVEREALKTLRFCLSHQIAYFPYLALARVKELQGDLLNHLEGLKTHAWRHSC